LTQAKRRSPRPASMAEQPRYKARPMERIRFFGLSSSGPGAAKAFRVTLRQERTFRRRALGLIAPTQHRPFDPIVAENCCSYRHEDIHRKDKAPIAAVSHAKKLLPQVEAVGDFSDPHQRSCIQEPLRQWYAAFCQDPDHKRDGCGLQTGPKFVVEKA